MNISIEQMENRWIAYITGLPGCFSSSESQPAAVAGVPAALRAYLDWSASNGAPLTGMDPDSPMEVQEIIREWMHPVTHEAINAFFAADAPPLTAEEAARALCLFDWTQADLLKAIAGLPQEILDRPVVGEWNISGIFYHTTRADWAYLRALGLAPDWAQAPAVKGLPDSEGLPALLDWTLSLYREALPGLAGQACIELTLGEQWSPRKMLRRALWHRRDHTDHIYQFRRALEV